MRCLFSRVLFLRCFPTPRLTPLHSRVVRKPQKYSNPPGDGCLSYSHGVCGYAGAGDEYTKKQPRTPPTAPTRPTHCTHPTHPPHPPTPRLLLRDIVRELVIRHDAEPVSPDLRPRDKNAATRARERGGVGWAGLGWAGLDWAGVLGGVLGGVGLN